MSRRYFAYGSNLDLPDWRRWCREHGLREELLHPLFTAVLPDRALAFTRRSVARNGGVLDIAPARGRWVEGVVFAVDEDGWRALERLEGAPNHYRAVDAEALSFDGEAHPVRTFEVALRAARAFRGARRGIPARRPRRVHRASGIATPTLDAAAADTAPASRARQGVRVRHADARRSAGGTAVIGERPGADVCPGRIPGRPVRSSAVIPGWRPDSRREAWVVGEPRTGITAPLLDELDRIEEFPGFHDRPGGTLPPSAWSRWMLAEGPIGTGVGLRALPPTGPYPRIVSGDWRAHRRASTGRAAKRHRRRAAGPTTGPIAAFDDRPRPWLPW
ncbi:MAG: gamma-glutamylcyclotransferase [Comamonadaceae bacterium]|nr:gamma-glutamylcyclotransferase [Comamonadaceae bacterium]